MQDAIRVLAGDCTVRYEGEENVRDLRGRVVTLVKPDDTVLVHDAAGYRPAAWLTRADVVRVRRDADGFVVDAGGDGKRLRVESREAVGHAHYPASAAGPAVGTCPDCDGALVRDGARVACVDCAAEYGIPRDATVEAATCSDCGLPRLSVSRGVRVEVCVDYACESLADAVADRVDGEWPCPDCGTGLRVRHERGLRAACPSCGRSLPVPAGTEAGTCECGCPLFDGPGGVRCLDPDCRLP